MALASMKHTEGGQASLCAKLEGQHLIAKNDINKLICIFLGHTLDKCQSLH